MIKSKVNDGGSKVLQAVREVRESQEVPKSEVPHETPDLGKVNAEQIRSWLKSDVQRCISMFVAILENESVLDELSEIFYSRMRQMQAEKAKEGQS